MKSASKRRGRKRPPAYPFCLGRVLKARGLSQRGFAAKYGFDYAIVNKWANGRKVPSWRSACRVAEALGVILDEFK